ncbi:helicase-associated domain-containing protein [Marininema halotolerans]|uniref:Helicase conserved C-terminal domain-containing protein n=1 Tax=Marininema halotolerans TaxID=1155944 RepID=A0A1I6RQ07_9BACL|nr:helicase-associated domain-containing protein [Marininema halotolerans]SFS66726.1 Helicase conserved C-terminal domain-containing protein [Marininema halotolerans]
MERLMGCLTSLSPQVRACIAKEHGWKEEETQDPTTMAARIVEAITDVAKGNRVEARMLRRVIFRGGNRLFSIRDEMITGEDSSLQMSMGWIGLQRKGFLYSFRKPWGEVLLWCPHEIREACLSVWFPHLPSARQGVSLNEVYPIGGFWNDVFQCLCMVDREPVPLTANGKMKQSFLRKVIAEMDLDDSGLEESPWGSDKFPRLSLLLSYAKKEGWLTDSDGRLRLIEDKAREWIGYSWEERLQRMYSFVQQELLHNRPEWDSLWYWMERHGQGATLLKDTFLAWKSVSGSTSRLEEWESKWLRPLQSLGWIEMGQEGGEDWWKWADWSPSVSRGLPQLSAYVKPDFEVLVPVFSAATERRALAQFADYMGGEQFYAHYELTPFSIRRGLERGLSINEMEQVLFKISAFPPPENILHSLRLWREQHSRVRIGTEVILQVASSQFADELMQDSMLSNHIRERVGPMAFLLHPDDLSVIRERLEARGTPALEIGERPRDGTDIKGSEHDALEGYGELTIENRIPAWKEAVPGVEQLPRMWTSAPRNYHPTMRRELLEKSAQMGLPIKWLDKEKQTHQFVTKRLYHTKGGWLAEGKDEQRQVSQSIPLEAMEQIQVILPWEE